MARGENPIVQVVSTGGGKSLSFMLPAYAGSDGITIVVVPLLALRQDIVTRCAQAQIPAEVFRSKAPPSVSASVVFVTPESAATSGFATFLQRVQGAFRLDRVVVDKCYMLLNATASAVSRRAKPFRQAILALGEAVACMGAQRIFLTATLPPRDEVRFYRAACINPVHMRLFRQPITRANLRYRVHLYRPSRRGGLGGLIAAEVRRLQLTYSKKAKIIVYGGTVKKGRPIAATNVLSAGVNIPDIYRTVHAAPPRMLRDYVQESGRAGCNRQRSKLILGSICRKEQAQPNQVSISSPSQASAASAAYACVTQSAAYP
ncbi:P-loop containing nucleoside triphosphate hydrolase protein [Xylaria sp. FL0933]|nr:P-loop containing nucleoside triphosphate hydrolase protein [Xylaria sp. FL0933]